MICTNNAMVWRRGVSHTPFATDKAYAIRPYNYFRYQPKTIAASLKKRFQHP